MNPGKKLVARFTAAFAFGRAAELLVLHGPFAGRLPPVAELLLADVVMFGVLGLLTGLSLMAIGFNRAWALAACSAAAGGLLFALAYNGVLRPLGIIPASAGYGLATGATLGCFQLPVLWRLLEKRALWPVLLSLGWALGYAIEYMIAGLLFEGAPAEQFEAMKGAADVLASMVIGGITGITFLFLYHGDLHDPARRADETGQEHRR